MLKVCPQCKRKYPEDIEFCAQDGTRLHELEDDTTDPLIGRALDGRWVIEKCIGMGGMGAVYLGSQRSVDRKVAIKTLKPELSNSREFVDRFFREARVATKISHPNCVTILDFGQTSDDTLYLAMEFLDGAELTDRLDQGDLTVREIIEICIQISSALAAAHASNIIHRDLKPENIYLLSISDESIFIKVLDFGIAKVLDAEEQMTQTGQVFGTPEYMSPEQCRGDAIDGRSDLYSLGCIMYRMLTGEPPFQADTPMAILVAHVSQQPEDVRGLVERDDIPEAFADLTMRLLSKQPEDRPADAQAVRAELETILDMSTTQANSAVPSRSGPVPVAAQAGTAADGGSPLAADSGPQNTESKPAQQKTENPNSVTHLPEALAPEKKRSVLPIVLGVLVFLVLGSGCVIGAYYAYLNSTGDDTQDVAEDEALAAHTDESDEPEAEGSTQNEGDEAAADDSKNAIAADSPDATDDTLLAARQTPDTGSPTAATASGQGSNSKASGNDADPDSVDKPAEKDRDKGPEENANTVTIYTDKVTINDRKENTKSDPEKTPDTPPKEPKKPKKPKEQKKPKKPAVSGNIRRASFSTTGEACLEPDVDSVLKSANRQFLSCYNDVLKSDPTVSGKVMMSWNITPDGGLLSPNVQMSDISSMNSCMLKKLKRLNFAPALGGRCYVRVTYSFSP